VAKLEKLLAEEWELDGNRDVPTIDFGDLPHAQSLRKVSKAARTAGEGEAPQIPWPRKLPKAYGLINSL
jgi:hypothetical protein